MPQTEPVSAFNPKLPDWYQLYFTAVLEADDGKVLAQIGRACKAIENRFIELTSSPADNPHEIHDLNCALTYLNLLLQNMQIEGGDVFRGEDQSWSSASF